MAESSKHDNAKLGSYPDGSDLLYDLICVPCHQDNVTKPAYGFCIDCKQHLCASCFNVHTIPVPVRHHRLQDQQVMPTSQQLSDPSTTIDVRPAEGLTALCPHHNSKVLEFFCNDHDMLLCNICMSLNHTKPCHVEYIPDISKQIHDSTMLLDTMDGIDKLIKKCNTIKTKMIEETKASNVSLKQALADVKTYRTDINKRIDKLEKDMEDNIRAIKEQNDEQLKAIETMTGDILKESVVLQDNIAHLNSFKLSNKLFVALKQAHGQLQYYVDSINDMTSQTYSVDEYKFVHEQAMLNILETQTNIGHLEICVKSISQNEICISTPNDSTRCLVTSMAELSPDKLIICDRGNSSIKLVDVNDRKVVSQLSLGTNYEDNPQDITKISEEQAAVTVPLRRYIQFVSVTNEIEFTRKIRTDGKCYGLCYYRDQLIVSFWFPTLKILDMGGNVIKTLVTDIRGEYIFSLPCTVQVNNRYLYVRDFGSRSIIMLNWNGDVLARLEGLKDPRGLILLHDDSLLVCDRENCYVYQVSGNLQKRKIIRKGLLRPEAMCVDDQQTKLYISRNADAQIGNTILIENI